MYPLEDHPDLRFSIVSKTAMSLTSIHMHTERFIYPVTSFITSYRAVFNATSERSENGLNHSPHILEDNLVRSAVSAHILIHRVNGIYGAPKTIFKPACLFCARRFQKKFICARSKTMDAYLITRGCPSGCPAVSGMLTARGSR
uniref:FAS1 domain-containing protein n=1 Tax=Steinernema glaseri TaxID=37863 RepID=A0A1I7ZLX0_9BILA